MYLTHEDCTPVRDTGLETSLREKNTIDEEDGEGESLLLLLDKYTEAKLARLKTTLPRILCV